MDGALLVVDMYSRATVQYYVTDQCIQYTSTYDTIVLTTRSNLIHCVLTKLVLQVLGSTTVLFSSQKI